MAPPNLVWAVLSNWADPSGWVPQLKTCEIIGPQRDGVGATRRLVEEDQVLIEKAIAWDAPRKLTIQVSGVPRVVRNVIDTFTIDTVDEKQVRFTVKSDSDMGLGLLGIALSPIAKHFQRKELQRLLAAMKHFVETDRRATHADVDRLLDQVN